MKTAITILLDEILARRLDEAARSTNKSRSEIAREALTRYLTLPQFQELRERIMPFAEAQGYLTDEDISRDVS
jgi:predicted transcriptional regulator